LRVGAPLVVPLVREGRLNQSRNCAVESTWSSCLPLGNTVISWRYAGEPGGVLAYMNKAVVDHRGLRVQTHDLVNRRLIARDTMTEVPISRRRSSEHSPNLSPARKDMITSDILPLLTAFCWFNPTELP
jgi:hypothetical protein